MGNPRVTGPTQSRATPGSTRHPFNADEWSDQADLTGATAGWPARVVANPVRSFQFRSERRKLKGKSGKEKGHSSVYAENGFKKTVKMVDTDEVFFKMLT